MQPVHHEGKLLSVYAADLQAWYLYPSCVVHDLNNHVTFMVPQSCMAAGLGQPPPHVKVVVAPLEDLPSTLGDEEDEQEDEAAGADGGCLLGPL
jgi:hypothetical protein